MQKIDVLDKNTIRSWQARWVQLSLGRFRNDRELAELAADIREELPAGPSGDIQFLTLLRRKFRGARPKRMLYMAHAFAVFSDIGEWEKLGGWQGISFLTALRVGQRNAVLRELKRPVNHYSTIRKTALRIGIVSPRKGRDSRLHSEGRVQTLQEFLLSLYRSKAIKGLPPIPANVKEALTKTTLAQLIAAVQAATA